MLLGLLGVFVNCEARCLENGAGIGDCVISIVSLLVVVIVHSKASVTSLVAIDRRARCEINVFDLGGAR